MAPHVSVVIPTYDIRNIMRRCLESLSKQDYTRDFFEIIIVDDGSNDGTGELFSQHSDRRDPDVTYIKQVNLGPAAARNNGLKHASGELVLFMDDDCIPNPDFITQHVDAHKRFSEVNYAILGYNP